MNFKKSKNKMRAKDRYMRTLKHFKNKKVQAKI